MSMVHASRGLNPPASPHLMSEPAIVAGIALIWLQLWQLWNEAKGSGARLRETITWSTIPTVDEPAPPTRAHEVIVVRETDSRD